MIELTQEQRNALDSAGAVPVRLTDPANQQEYVLLRADVFERLRSLLDEDFRPSMAYPAVDRAFAPGWDEPRMDDYDR